MLVNLLANTSLSQQRWILRMHFFICSIGLVKLAMILAGNFYEANILDFALGKLGKSALEVGVGKLGSFLQYFSGLAFLSLFYGVTAWFVAHRVAWPVSFWTRSSTLVLYFVLNSIFTWRIFQAGASLTSWLPVWLMFTLLLPIAIYGFSLKKFPVLPKSLVWLLCLGLVLQLGFVFQPLIFKTMMVENDYMDIAGQTQLNSGEWVDNTRFINQHNIGGIYKYDPRVDRGETPLQRQGTYVAVKNSPLLSTFLDADVNSAKLRYHYYPTLGLLSVRDEMTVPEHELLRYVYPDVKDKQQIDQLYLLTLKQKTFYKNRIYTADEWDFIEKNKIELIDQAKTGWFFYHHNYFFGPIFGLAHGNDVQHQPLVYGWFVTLLFVKLLPYLGGVNYQSYFKLFFAIYPLYFFSFMALVLVMFRRIEYALLAVILSLAALFLLGIEAIRLAPGFNPVRHFLDVFVFLSFYLYFKQKQGRNFWLVLSLGLSLLAMLFNKEFGMFLLVAVGATTVLHEWMQKKWISIPVLCIFVAGLVGMYAYAWAIPGKNPAFMYMLLGEGSPVTPAILVRGLLLVNAFLYFLLWTFRPLKNSVNAVWLSIVLYCQFLLIYLLWFPQAHHLYGMSVPFILLALCGLYLGIRYWNLENIERRILSWLTVLLLLFVYIPCASFFYNGVYHYQKNFQTHRLYSWPFASAQLISTMNPQLFLDATQLIKHYAPESGIYLISKYDDLLPVLAGKYNAMPYPELLTNLLNANVVNSVANFIKTTKPNYLFVDTDIDRSFYNEIYSENDPMAKKFKLHEYSYDRAHVFDRLKLLFSSIKDEYKPLAKGELITVYQRVDH